MGLLNNGFELKVVEEAEPPKEMMDIPGMEDELRRPMMLLVKAIAKNNISIRKLIYPNLENGIVIPSDKEKMIALANKYIEKENVDALILACTELPLAIKPEDVNVPIVNTTQVHINAIYQYAIR